MFPIYPHMPMIPLQPFVHAIPQMQMQIPLQQIPLLAPLPPLLPPQQHFQQLQPQTLLLQPLPPHRHAQPLMPPPALPVQKTLYILSYSTEVLKRHPNAEAQLMQQHVPSNLPALITIYCHKWRAPPREICDRYSGISPQVQQFILGSRTAMGEINKAITAIANHFNAGNQVASIQTTCHAGMHRSVAAAEIVANETRRRSVNVVVRHAHRRRGVGDAR
ncbi:hypothetical protein BKA58DRAFT_425059 [Alternaria rosae]|uniref:uncharacterized protein n=1 Tax=Alternaria rosae TaxID=1187941 RepID=UPI001E8EA9E3|nr:uncharacterized protein BKA58DRAFT_425059 [Alternaria rosae]KAH6851527.1 hypothetical protein BKA58DRAFT_425059 [Alternaria rosae]